MQFTLGHLLLTVSFYALELKSTCIKLPTTQFSCLCIFLFCFGISLSHTWYKYFTYRYIPVIGHQHQYSHVPRFISDLYMEVLLTYLSVYAFGTWSTNVHNNTHESGPSDFLLPILPLFPLFSARFFNFY